MSYKNREQCSEKLRLNFNDVKKEYEKYDCVLLSDKSEYKNTLSVLTYRCKCGNIISKKFAEFKYNNWMCNECSKKHRSKIRAINNGFGFDDINNSFLLNNHQLLTIKEYYVSTDIIEYKCLYCGNINKKPLKMYRTNSECTYCRKELDRLKRWKDNVEYAKKNNVKILSTYDEFYSNHSRLLFQCACGNTYTAVVNEFRNAHKVQCNKCGIKSRSGENSPRWDGGKTNENEKIRNSTDYIEWRKSVLGRDNYTCQCCGDNTGGNLQAHHKYNFSEYPELRLDVNNGITLCKKCHDFNQIGSFHHTYGVRNNTPEQLEEYINNYKMNHQENQSNDSLLLCSND